MGDIFFPFLPGSGTAEKYYDALQAAAVNRYYKKAPAVKTSGGMTKTSDVDTVNPILQPGIVPQPPMIPPRSSSRQAMAPSPPVPALLKRIKIANGGDAASGGDGYDSSDNKDVKIGKDFENLQIKEQRHCTEQDKQDLLFRLSLLKQVIVKII